MSLGINYESYVRKLAKTRYYQGIYSFSKESHLKIFQNDTDLSEVQFLFMKYLGFYNNLFTDIALDEVSDKVLENEIFEDAYWHYKNTKITKDNKNKDTVRTKDKIETQSTSQWLFKKPQGK